MAKRRGHGEGSCYRQPDGRWVASITLPPTGDGRQHKRRVRRPTQRAALAALKDLQRELGAGIEPGRVTLKAHYADWIERQERSDKGVSTVDGYRWAAEDYLLPAFGALLVRKVRPEHVEAVLAKMQKGGAAKSTMMRVRSVANKLMTDARKRRLIDWNPVAETEVPAGPAREGRSLSDDEVAALIDIIRGDRLEACFLTMLWCGLRPAEVRTLLWDDVDLEAGVLYVGRSYAKTEDSVRGMVLPTPLADALRTHRARQAAEKMRRRDVYQDSGFVFATRLGTQLDRGNLRRSFGDLTEQADLGRLHPYILRHTYATICREDGVDADLTRFAMGHSPGSRTLELVYRHQAQATVGAAAASAIERRYGTAQ